VEGWRPLAAGEPGPVEAPRGTRDSAISDIIDRRWRPLDSSVTFSRRIKPIFLGFLMGKCSVICPLELMLTMGFNLVNKLLRFVPLFCRMDVNSSYRLAMRVGDYVKFNDDGSRGYCNACRLASHSEQRVDQGREGTDQLQKVEMERERRDVKGANSLDIWRKLAMNMFMILTHHHLLFQSQRERESRKKSLTTDLHPQL